MWFQWELHLYLTSEILLAFRLHLLQQHHWSFSYWYYVWLESPQDCHNMVHPSLDWVFWRHSGLQHILGLCRKIWQMSMTNHWITWEGWARSMCVLAILKALNLLRVRHSWNKERQASHSFLFSYQSDIHASIDDTELTFAIQSSCKWYLILFPIVSDMQILVFVVMELKSSFFVEYKSWSIRESELCQLHSHAPRIISWSVMETRTKSCDRHLKPRSLGIWCSPEWGKWLSRATE